jgi:phosphinothricin acetyltransferase
MLIRDATPSDVGAIHAIYGHHVVNGLGTFELEQPSLEEMLIRLESVVGAGLPFLVADDEGTLQGYAYASRYRPRQAYRFTAEDSVYVAPAAQRRGVGRALLDALVDRCAASGIRQLMAVVGDSANLASIRVHEAAGFRRVGLAEGVGWKHGRWVDTVFMQRQLGDGSATPPSR